MVNKNTKKISRVQFYGLTIWLLGALFFFMEYFVRISPSVITHDLMSALNVNALALGGLSAFFYYAYIGMQIPVGIIVDHFGAKKPMVFAVGLCAFGCFLFAISHNIWLSDISRFILGFGAAFAFVGTFKLISQYFKPKMFALLAGMTQGLGMLGAAVGDAPISIIFHHFGWRQSMIGVAVLFVVLMVLILLIARDAPKVKSPMELPRGDIATSLKLVLANKHTWVNCLYIGLLYAPTASFAGLWGVSYLTEYERITETAAAVNVGAIFIGLAIGCPLFGFISDRIGRRVILMKISAATGCILISLIIYGQYIGLPRSSDITMVICFLYGFSNSGLTPSYTLGSELNPHRYTGIAVGVTNMASVIIGAAFIPIIGAILDMVWNGYKSGGAPVFKLHDYQTAFILLPVCLAISFFVSFFVKETYAKRID